MSNNKEQIYIPRRKVKKALYLDLKEASETYDILLNDWRLDLVKGLASDTKKLKARELMENTPNLSVFREVLKTDPVPGEEKVAEGIRYWVMKENGTLPIREKPASLSGMAAVCDSPIVLVVEAKKEEKLSFGKRMAGFFGF